MRRRLYFIMPDLASARKMMDDLLLARIEERHIHVLARRGTAMDGLHEASHLQKSDLVHGAQVRRLDRAPTRRSPPTFEPRPRPRRTCTRSCS